jgi:imidazoleglycerol-phosphate dehydratase
MKMRIAKVNRKTKETDIKVEINIDGTGQGKINTGIDFFNHMLTQISRHGLLDLKITAKGDLKIDQHHTVEDVGITLGSVLKNALKDKKGIRRYGFAIVPFDETLILAALDISGRPFLNFDVNLNKKEINGFDTELIQEFLRGFVTNAGITLHIKQLAGKNTHHIIEACFKAIGLAIKEACSLEKRIKDIPSSKGNI